MVYLLFTKTATTRMTTTAEIPAVRINGFPVHPAVVVTVDIQGIVAHSDGRLTFRSPRFVRIHETKPVEEISTYSSVRRAFEVQSSHVQRFGGFEKFDYGNLLMIRMITMKDTTVTPDASITSSVPIPPRIKETTDTVTASVPTFPAPSIT